MANKPQPWKIDGLDQTQWDNRYGVQLTWDNLAETLQFILDKSGLGMSDLSAVSGVNRDTCKRVFSKTRRVSPESGNLDKILAGLGWQIVIRYPAKFESKDPAASVPILARKAPFVIRDYAKAKGLEMSVLIAAKVVSQTTYWNSINGFGEMRPKSWFRAFEKLGITVFLIPVTKSDV